jgi:riboflavin synthase
VLVDDVSDVVEVSDVVDVSVSEEEEEEEELLLQLTNDRRTRGVITLIYFS